MWLVDTEYLDRSAQFALKLGGKRLVTMGAQSVDGVLGDVTDSLDLFAQLDQLVESLDVLSPAPRSQHGTDRRGKFAVDLFGDLG
ncbi:hypothetical protein AHiyo8_00500 [Arthrobacter sp. Hiyo8]|nr:hypothetical protein AHiyo8_00500 [Arthrobacter sp. Hiyo8]